MTTNDPTDMLAGEPHGFHPGEINEGPPPLPQHIAGATLPPAERDQVIAQREAARLARLEIHMNPSTGVVTDHAPAPVDVPSLVILDQAEAAKAAKAELIAAADVLDDVRKTGGIADLLAAAHRLHTAVLAYRAVSR